VTLDPMTQFLLERIKPCLSWSVGLITLTSTRIKLKMKTIKCNFSVDLLTILIFFIMMTLSEIIFRSITFKAHAP